MAAGGKITVKTKVGASLDEVWDAYVNPDDITKWNFASDDWHCPSAAVDLREGGTFTSRMESRDGRAGFDFSGRYSAVVKHRRIEYEMEDGRRVEVLFRGREDGVVVEVTFDAETVYSPEKQEEGWRAILDNFRRYVEGSRAAKS